MQPAVQSMQALVRRYYLVFMDFVIGGIIGGIHLNNAVIYVIIWPNLFFIFIEFLLGGLFDKGFQY